MADQQTYVVVGGGLAGGKAAQTLREEGFEGRVVLVTAESEPPYERPPLSKDYLRGESPREKALVQPEGYWGEHGIELITGVSATALDPGGRRVTLADGRELAFDRLLIATGAIPRRPPIPGAELDGVFVLRTMADSDALRATLERRVPLVVVGGGWIGCEVAASARQRDVEVALVELASAPLEGVLGREVGGWFAELHRARGVRLHLGVGVDRLEGDGRVRRVVLADGTELDAGCVVLGVGVTPDTRLAESAGLEIEDGVAVDEHLRTSADGIYAAGDVASALHPRYGRRIRVEHWSAALNQGPAAARSMLGRGEPYDRLPYFFSDQYDAGMEYVGLHGREDRIVVRGSLDSDRFSVVWAGADGRATAAMHVNDWDAMDGLRELVTAREAVIAG